MKRNSATKPLRPKTGGQSYGKAFAVLGVLLAVSLAGCTVVETMAEDMRLERLAEQNRRAALAQQEQEEFERHREAVLAERRRKCTSFGFHENTPEFANCMLQLYQQAQQNLNMQNQAIMGALMNGYIQNQEPYRVPALVVPPGLLHRPPPVYPSIKPVAPAPTLNTVCTPYPDGVTRCTTN